MLLQLERLPDDGAIWKSGFDFIQMRNVEYAEQDGLTLGSRHYVGSVAAITYTAVQRYGGMRTHRKNKTAPPDTKNGRKQSKL